MTAGQLTVSQLAVEGCARSWPAGSCTSPPRSNLREDPGCGYWLATIVAAAATAACFATLRTASSETVTVPLIGEDPSGVTAQVAAFWLISSGVAILVTARSPVRGSLGAILMVTGVELLVRLLTVPQLGLSLLLAWVEVVIALAGGFLIVNERVVRES